MITVHFFLDVDSWEEWEGCWPKSRDKQGMREDCFCKMCERI